MKAIKLALGAVFAMSVMWAGGAQALVITGQLWHVPDAVAQNAIPANLPVRAPDVTFDVNSPINFTTAGSTNTFLTSGGAFNIHELTAGALAAAISPSLIEFLGQVTVTNNQQFTVTHDDGLTLTIGGLTVISTPGPTGPVQTTQTYTGPSGTFPFQLVYGECCSGSAVLQISLPFVNAPPVGGNAPEPGILMLLAAGLAGVGISRRRDRAGAKS